MDNIFSDIKPLLREIRKPSRYIGGEYNSPKIDKDAKQFNFCMIYPDVYEIGQSNQAVRILCNCVNNLDDFAAQRAYLPDPKSIEIFRKNNIDMFSLETFSPLCQFDAIGITVSHELVATNILEVLDFANIEILSEDRGENDPFVFGGGPMSCNPEPYYAFFDIITIGEGEQATIDALKALKKLKEAGACRKEILHELAKMESIYVPSLYKFSKNDNSICAIYDDVPKVVTKAIYKDFAKSSAYENCIVPFCEIVHDRFNVEIIRGCARACRFCQAGIMYRPVRERSAKNICDAVVRGIKDTGYNEISLTSLSSTDHSQISQILENLNNDLKNSDVRISIPSQRMDSFGVDMAKNIAGRKKAGLTFAIEAGTQRLRNVINKNLDADDIFKTIKAAFSSGWNRAKLYFMIGLPTETDKDIIGIANLAEEIYKLARDTIEPKRKSSVTINISCAIFIPKAQTPFMYDGYIGHVEALRRINLIRSNIKSKAIKFSWHDSQTSLIEAILSRGGRQCSKLIELAWKNGSKFDAWDEYFDFDAWVKAANTLNIDLEKMAGKTYSFNSKFPWSHISFGVDENYFISERKKASSEISTPDCSVGKCSNCGLCANLDTANEIAGKRL